MSLHVCTSLGVVIAVAKSGLEVGSFLAGDSTEIGSQLWMGFGLPSLFGGGREEEVLVSKSMTRSSHSLSVNSPSSISLSALTTTVATPTFTRGLDCPSFVSTGKPTLLLSAALFRGCSLAAFIAFPFDTLCVLCLLEVLLFAICPSSLLASLYPIVGIGAL